MKLHSFKKDESVDNNPINQWGYEQCIYQKLTIDDFLNNHVEVTHQVKQYELSLPWLQATYKYTQTSEAKLWFHCLMQGDQVKMALPLVHFSDNAFTGVKIKSLTSFYSAVTAPYFCNSLNSHQRQQLSEALIQAIIKQNVWQQISLGPFEKDSFITQALLSNVYFQRLYAQSENWYEDNIESFELYSQSRPSQLRNTIKRREKKLRQSHHYSIEILTDEQAFKRHFSHYQNIYRQSWKGDEFSVEFIEQVCLEAILSNKLRMGMLFIDGIPVAAQIWFVEQKTASIFKLAYLPEYQCFSVGSILSMALSKYVIDNDHVTEIEFGMGNEPYKKDWMSKNRQRAVWQVFNHRNFYGNLAAVRYVLLPKIKKLFTNTLDKL